MSLMLYHLVFTLRAETTVALDEYSGSAWRGALTTALWARFCTNQAAPTCVACPLVHACPVAALVAPLRAEDEPGSEQQPRPYVLEPPPSGARVYPPGSTLSFGLSLLGPAATLFPYVVMAAQQLQHYGIGRKLPENQWQRGKVVVETITAVQPLAGERQVLYEPGQRLVTLPGLAITATDVAAYAQALPTTALTLALHTPLRLIEQGHLLHQIAFRPLLQRLLRRFDDLSRAYGDGPLNLDYQELLAAAAHITVREDQTHWADIGSYSQRQQRRTPIGGLVGRVTFQGELVPFRELLVWGQLLHVGRNAVKGNGWYSIHAP